MERDLYSVAQLGEGNSSVWDAPQKHLGNWGGAEKRGRKVYKLSFHVSSVPPEGRKKYLPPPRKRAGPTPHLQILGRGGNICENFSHCQIGKTECEFLSKENSV